MRGTSRRALAVALVLAAAPAARAAGPLSFRNDGTPYRWVGTVPYNPDQGPLGIRTNAQATADVASNFAVWEAVPTATVAFQNAGALPVDVNDNCPSASCWQNFLGVCGDGRSPIVYDADGSITDDIYGVGANNSILGFAGPECASTTTATISEGYAVLNGRFLDGINTSANRESSVAGFNAVFIHEFGHYINLDHSQVNLTEAFDGNGANDDAIATMFPFLSSVQQASLHLDDVVSVSTLYPTASFASTTGKLSGTIRRSDGSPFQGAHVIARRVGNPRLDAVGVVSGARYRASGGNAALQGLYEIPGLPPGDYTVEIEAIYSGFTGGSSVGPVDPPAMLPGPPEFWNGSNESGTSADDPSQSSVIAVGAATSIANVDVIINGAAAAPTRTATPIRTTTPLRTSTPVPTATPVRTTTPLRTATPVRTATRTTTPTPTPVATAAALCASSPRLGCVAAGHASLEANERTPGRERLKLQWRKLVAPTTQAAFGDPVTGTTRVALCLYDDQATLVRGLVVDRAGSLCGSAECWRTVGARGYRYQDKLAASVGVTKASYLAGEAGQGRVDAAAANNAAKGQTALPTGIAARLAGNTAPTVQLVTSDGFCVGATMSEVRRDADGVYAARQ